MAKKIIITCLIIAVIPLMFILFFGEENNQKILSKTNQNTNVENQAVKIKQVKRNNNQDSLITNESPANEDKQTDQKKKPAENKTSKIFVEKAFLANENAVSLSFAEAIQDQNIFSTAINALEEESLNNQLAQENKDIYTRVMLDNISSFMEENEDLNMYLDNLQCGEHTCLVSLSSSSEETWSDFKDSVFSIENGVYVATSATTLDGDAAFHNVFISVDENVNSFRSDDPISLIEFTGGHDAVINYDPLPGGG